MVEIFSIFCNNGATAKIFMRKNVSIFVTMGTSKNVNGQEVKFFFVGQSPKQLQGVPAKIFNGKKFQYF